MCCNMISLITFNFILGIFSGSMMRIAFVVEIGFMNFNNSSGSASEFQLT